jgi:hypothetical protein
LAVEGLDTSSVRFGVAIAYISPDLTVLGVTVPYGEQSQARIETELAGQIPVGLLFGIWDATGPIPDVGSRAFLNIKQTEEWLTELRAVFALD